MQTAGRTVLIVDDEPVIRTIASTSLARAGFVVAEAGDADTAMERLRKASPRFDLVLLDLTLGAVNGADLIPLIRQQSPETRILVFSGLGHEDAEGIGSDGYLSKPFTRTTLMIAVWKALMGLSAIDPKP